jgi:hypothetical protein
MRKKFNADEREIIAWCMSDHHFNTVKWKDGSNWSKFARIKPGKVLTDEFGFEYIEAVNITTTATCEYGRKIRIYPSGIRKP